VRIRLFLLTALVLAGSATAASGLQIHFPRQENLLLGACDMAATNIGSAVQDASTTQVQTIETQLRVLTPGRLVGDIAFGRPGSSVAVVHDSPAASDAQFNCGHGESAGRVGAGPGPAHPRTVSILRETFTAPGLYTVSFTLNQAGLRILARVAAAERAYHKRHPHGDQPVSMAWGMSLHYFPVH
jgi:hypothetical protein